MTDSRIRITGVLIKSKRDGLIVNAQGLDGCLDEWRVDGETKIEHHQRVMVIGDFDYDMMYEFGLQLWIRNPEITVLSDAG